MRISDWSSDVCSSDLFKAVTDGRFLRSIRRKRLFRNRALCNGPQVRRNGMRATTIMMLMAPLALGGCVSTVKSVVTAPVKAAGQVADWSTTSQDEADRNRGRAMREREDGQIGRASWRERVCQYV